MQRWLCVYLLEWTTGLTFMQYSYGDIIINTSQSCIAKGDYSEQVVYGLVFVCSYVMCGHGK